MRELSSKALVLPPALVRRTRTEEITGGLLGMTKAALSTGPTEAPATSVTTTRQTTESLALTDLMDSTWPDRLLEMTPLTSQLRAVTMASPSGSILSTAQMS